MQTYVNSNHGYPNNIVTDQRPMDGTGTASLKHLKQGFVHTQVSSRRAVEYKACWQGFGHKPVGFESRP